MAKSKTKNPLGYKTMPKYDDLRSGCKVGWRYYKDEAVAKQAAEIARHNAEIDASQGYDFGYCSPGSVRLVKGAVGEMAHLNGMWEVCVS